MTTFVITIPGTFLREADARARADIAERLRPVDPNQTELGREEDLDLLTVNDDNTFSMRLEVTAGAGGRVEQGRRAIAGRAPRRCRAAGSVAQSFGRG
ncbi:hypothetical protein, partial [Streptomyces sp. NPDC046939]|uniref:hypothetical protein n=1 Tax=Streptomyces sp. NPDC046939 TaxID=3155376 RepID=UPI0033CA0612